MKKLLITTAVLFLSFISLQSFTSKNVKSDITLIEKASNCIAKENLDEICEDFISKCRRGSIRSKFPSQFYKVKIRVVRNGKSKDHKTAWKLINDRRFKK